METRNKLGQFLKINKDLSYIIEEFIAKITISGQVIIIDAEDIPLIKNYRWNITFKPSPYVRSYDENKKTIQLARLILNAPKNTVVDHINRNTLDNRKCNLRIVNNSLNAINSKVRTDNVSGFKGVSWDKSRKLYRAYITKNRKLINLGRFKTLESAVDARKIAELKYHKFEIDIKDKK